jgi:protein-S-isoprenylcysteine O-methyltransferase Ste14
MTDTRPSTSQLLKLVFSRLFAGFGLLVAMLFLSAGTFAYWEAWAYLAVLLVPMSLVLVYLLNNAPELLERRMRLKEKEPAQKLILTVAFFCFMFAFLLPGFDQRFGWSRVPAVVVIVADILVLLGYGIVFLVFRENHYASRIIEVEPGQKVISSGPYALIRHPMYLGESLMFIFSPLALGSYWAMIPAAGIAFLLVARIRNEESVMIRELKGYPEYMKKTVYRLIPGVW